MNKIFTIILLLAAHFIFAQQQSPDNKTIFETALPAQFVKITIPIRGYDVNDIGALKDDLISFSEKVIDVRIDEINNKLELRYNSKMLIQDLISSFEAHRIPYLRQDNKDVLIEVLDR